MSLSESEEMSSAYPRDFCRWNVAIAKMLKRIDTSAWPSPCDIAYPLAKFVLAIRYQISTVGLWRGLYVDMHTSKYRSMSSKAFVPAGRSVWIEGYPGLGLGWRVCESGGCGLAAADGAVAK